MKNEQWKKIEERLLELPSLCQIEMPKQVHEKNQDHIGFSHFASHPFSSNHLVLLSRKYFERTWGGCQTKKDLLATFWSPTRRNPKNEVRKTASPFPATFHYFYFHSFKNSSLCFPLLPFLSHISSPHLYSFSLEGSNFSFEEIEGICSLMKKSTRLTHLGFTSPYFLTSIC